MRRLSSPCAAAAMLVAGIVALTLPASTGSRALAGSGDAFAYGFTAIEGHELPLEQFRGRPMLIANTASFCAFTRQYGELQRLWERYRDRGLVVLGVPSDDFNQEMDDDAAIREFCEVQFGIDFPMTERVSVRGRDSHPLFSHIRSELGQRAGPNWNFFKYLIAPDGRVVGSWSSRVAPDAAAIVEAIEALLPAS